MDYRLKHFLKKSGLISRLGYKIRENKTKKNILAFKDSKTQKNKILFASGRYNDSLCSVYEALKEKNPELEFVWVYRAGDEKYIDEYPEGIKPVLFESADYFRELATSSVWVFNVLIPQGTVKRKDQLYIQVWHGDKPFKKIGNEAAQDKKNYRKQSRGRKFSENELCDYFMTGSILFIDIWERSMGYSGKVIDTGLPRNDILLKDYSKKADFVRNELGISSDVKVLMYAPTFRDHIVDNSVIGTDIDLSEALDSLEKKYGCKWICLKRSHGGTKLSLDGTSDEERIVDVSRYRDMTNLLLVSDALITDYSSCAGDFAYTGKPVLLYQDDYDIYTSMDRSLIFDMNKTPFYAAHNMDELKSLIEKLDENEVKENDRQILELYQSSQTDHSASDAAEVILNHIASI